MNVKPLAHQREFGLGTLYARLITAVVRLRAQLTGSTSIKAFRTLRLWTFIPLALNAPITTVSPMSGSVSRIILINSQSSSCEITEYVCLGP